MLGESESLNGDNTRLGYAFLKYAYELGLFDGDILCNYVRFDVRVAERKAFLLRVEQKREWFSPRERRIFEITGWEDRLERIKESMERRGCTAPRENEALLWGVYPLLRTVYREGLADGVLREIIRDKEEEMRYDGQDIQKEIARKRDSKKKSHSQVTDNRELVYATGKTLVSHR